MIAQLVWFVGVAFVTAIFAGISAKLPIPSGQIRRDSADQADDLQVAVDRWRESRHDSQESPIVTHLLGAASRPGKPPSTQSTYFAMDSAVMTSECPQPAHRKPLLLARYAASVGCVVALLIGLVVLAATDPRQTALAPAGAPGMASAAPTAGAAVYAALPSRDASGGDEVTHPTVEQGESVTKISAPALPIATPMPIPPRLDVAPTRPAITTYPQAPRGVANSSRQRPQARTALASGAPYGVRRTVKDAQTLIVFEPSGSR